MSLPLPQSTAVASRPSAGTNLISASSPAANNLFAAVDIGTSSFKLTLVRIHPTSGLFLTSNHLKESVLLGLDTTSTSATPTISDASIDRSVSALLKFQNFLNTYCLPNSHLRLVATSAVREAQNKSQFISTVQDTLELNVEILSGIQEARLIYLGVLQFYPVFTSTVLTVDIGGGSTEFTVGFQGNVLFSKSLNLGHVTLTQQFTDIIEMRGHIRRELRNCDLIEKIKSFKIDEVIGTSGTIKAIEKAAFLGYANNLEEDVYDFVKREWKFNKDELRCLAERLCEEEVKAEGKERKEGFFKKRAPFILAGTILLNEIFELVGIEEMKVSGYALGEGVITEMMGQVIEGFDLKANAKWRSVAMLSSRFNSKKRMQAATMCAGIAREIFEGLRKSREDELSVVSLDKRDFGYLEAASLLHNVGLYAGKKGYHKLSYRVVVNGDHLHGYSAEEIKKIGLLVRFHRKKFPKGSTLEGFSTEEKQKFMMLCAILRVSVAVLQSLPVNMQILEFNSVSEGFELVLSEIGVRNESPAIQQPLDKGINASINKELEFFTKVFKKNLLIVLA